MEEREGAAARALPFQLFALAVQQVASSSLIHFNNRGQTNIP